MNPFDAIDGGDDDGGGVGVLLGDEEKEGCVRMVYICRYAKKELDVVLE